jgi:hypothetical protein
MIMNENLQNTIASILQAIADFFGLTIDAVTTNAMPLLADYGWFHTLTHSLPICAGLIFGLGTVVALFAGIFLSMDYEFSIPKYIIGWSIGLFVLFLFVASFFIIPCFICPEMVGAQAIIDQLMASKC